MTDCTPTCGDYAVEIAKPLDAEGKPIPLDTTLLYDRDGRGIVVNEFKFKINTATRASSWIAVAAYEGAKNWGTFMPQSLFIEKPDSIKQLAEDLNRAFDVGNAQEKGCRYMPCYYDNDRGAHCNDCRLNSHGKMDCLDAMIADIVSRVNRLCGDSE